MHEHLYSTKSWELPEVQEVMNTKGVRLVRGDMCAHGMYQGTDDGKRFVMKPTGFMTIASEIGKQLESTCNGTHM